MADWASESSHWYTPSGEARHTVVGANGKERPTTLRDARKLGLYPSVTTIIRCAAAPGLESWKRKQLALACLTLPRIEGETADDFLKRVDEDWQKEGKDAADRGVAIHAALEQFYRDEPIDQRWWPHIGAARDELALYCGDQKWSPERSFSHSLGYGGKVDLHSDDWIVDAKSKVFDVNSIPEVWDEHLLQLAAYRRGLGVKARCAILFVSASVPGLAVFKQVKEEDLARGLTAFDGLLQYWKATKNYWPEHESRSLSTLQTKIQAVQ